MVPSLKGAGVIRQRPNNTRGRQPKATAEGMEQQITRSMVPHRAGILVDPPQVTPSITAKKRIQLTMEVTPSTPSSGTLRFSDLMAGVPGGLTYWASFRVERIDFWSMWNGQAANTITVTIPTASSWGQPALEWSDSGVPGKRRAHVGFKLGLIQRTRFVGVAVTDTICVVTVDGPATTSNFVTVQASIELVSPLLV